MHYLPLASGTGLLVLGNGLPTGSLPLLLARLFVDLAGLVFIALSLIFLFSDFLARVRGASSVERPHAPLGRHFADGATAEEFE